MMRAASPPTHHPLPYFAPSASRRAKHLEADIPHQKRLLFTAPTPWFEVGESFNAAATRQSRSTMAYRCKVPMIVQLDPSYGSRHKRQRARVDTLEDTGSSA
ncbi:hypothetical protein Tco_0695101 [Tanacetum coccineum]